MSNLPNGWKLVELENIALINPRHPRNLDDSIQLSFTPMIAIAEDKPDFKFTQTKTLCEVKKGYTHFAEGDILFAKITPCMENGKAAIARNLANQLGCGTTEVHVIRPLLKIPSEYIYYFIHRELFRKEAAKNMTGTAGQLRVPTDYIKSTQIPLPPLNEQRRIVAKLEKLLAKVNACQERLDKITAILRRLRQSILAGACSGRLTADWREQHPDIEPAEAFTSQFNTKERKDCIGIFEESCLYDLPSSWQYIPLGKLGKLTGGGTPSKANPDYWQGIIPWVSAKDMKLDRISDSIDHISEDAVNNSSTKKIPVGSILFVVRGMILAHTFPVAITDSTLTINQDLKALIPVKKETGEYLFIAIKSIAKNILFATKEATHGTRRIETQVLQNWAIPWPPLEEQEEIVRRVENLFQKCDQIEARYQTAKAYTDKLTQAILAKAFRGELVPQDPNDEPAEVLLERIKAEKDGAEPQKKRRQSQSKPGKKEA